MLRQTFLCVPLFLTSHTYLRYINLEDLTKLWLIGPFTFIHRFTQVIDIGQTLCLCQVYIDRPVVMCWRRLTASRVYWYCFVVWTTLCKQIWVVLCWLNNSMQAHLDSSGKIFLALRLIIYPSLFCSIYGLGCLYIDSLKAPLRAQVKQF